MEGLVISGGGRSSSKSQHALGIISFAIGLGLQDEKGNIEKKSYEGFYIELVIVNSF